MRTDPSAAQPGFRRLETAAIHQQREEEFMVHHIGTPGNDTLDGTEINDTLEGLAGDDTLRGHGAVDFLYGGDGNDRLEGGLGNDLLDGGAGNDTIYASDASLADSTADHIDGGDGQDMLIVRLASIGGSGAVLITNTDPGAVTHASTGLEFHNIETLTIYGTSFDDRIDGGDGNDVISGQGGQDTIFGRGGDDILVVSGPGGALVGGDGNDQLQAGDGGSRLQGGNGDDHLSSSSGSDRLDGDGGNDVLIGLEANDFLYGGDGNDTLSGDGPIGSPGDLDNYLFFSGKDVLQGGAGDDVLIGGLDKDTLTGGSGADRFVYVMQDSLPGAANRDVITDFSQADGDQIDLSGYAVAGVISPIESHFSFIGTDAFTGTTPNLDGEGNIINYNGQVNYHYDGANTVISGDANGDGTVDLEIVVFGHIALTAGDFTL
jgi:Ca2+-binding RTX toxin-like protein